MNLNVSSRNPLTDTTVTKKTGNYAATAPAFPAHAPEHFHVSGSRTRPRNFMTMLKETV